MSDDDSIDGIDIVYLHGPSPKERRRLDLERQIAAIHAEARALVWTGTAEELTATITRWYESGCLMAESLADALRKASMHFVKPDGSLVLTPQPTSTPVPQEQAETNPRRAFVMPLLEKRGWSILDWANEARVDHATAVNYLDSKRKQYRSTRLKLANALKVSADQLPK